MRKVIFESSVSLDGFIEGPDGELDWLVFEPGCDNAAAFLSTFDTVFCGRKAYEKFGVHASPGDDLSAARAGFLSTLCRMRKYVFSRTLKHVAGNGMVVCQNLEAEVTRIREEDGKNIWFCGGADIMRTFAELDLVDEYLLAVHPVTLHAGKPLFPDKDGPRNLTLVNRRNLKSGVVILRYLPQSRLKKPIRPW